MPSQFQSSSGLPPLDGPNTGMHRAVSRSDQRDSRPAGQSGSADPSRSYGTAPVGWGGQSGTTGSYTRGGDAASGRGGGTSGEYLAATNRLEDRQTADEGNARGRWDEDEDLLNASKIEYEQVGRELDEIRMLIKQSSAELEKLNQRKVLAAAKTREMEERIETFSRQEIRASYLASSEAEMRAFMMAEQREQLQTKQKVFERYQGFLQRAIDVLSALPAGAGTGAWPTTAPTWGPAPGQAPPTAIAPRDQGTATLARVIQAQEDVRQRVAQRLHDGPAQSLANVVLTAEICEKLIQSDPRRAQGELGNLKGLVNTTLQDTRKFIFELRPMTLDDLGLIPTLRRYVADLGARFQVQITLVAPQGEQRLPNTMEVPIFRVAQEALSNAVQHGRATQVRVSISVLPDNVVLTIEDNGAGFDVEQALAKATARQTLGIASMQERAEMLGGWLRIESARGHGSRVELSVPVT